MECLFYKGDTAPLFLYPCEVYEVQADAVDEVVCAHNTHLHKHEVVIQLVLKPQGKEPQPWPVEINKSIN